MESSRNIKHSTSHFTMHLLFSKQSPPTSLNVMFRWCCGGLCKVNLKCVLLSHPLRPFCEGSTTFSAWTDSHTLKFPLKDLSILQQPDEKFFQMLGGFEWRYCILTSGWQELPKRQGQLESVRWILMRILAQSNFQHIFVVSFDDTANY